MKALVVTTKEDSRIETYNTNIPDSLKLSEVQDFLYDIVKYLDTSKGYTISLFWNCEGISDEST